MKCRSPPMATSSRVGLVVQRFTSGRSHQPAISFIENLYPVTLACRFANRFSPQAGNRSSRPVTPLDFSCGAQQIHSPPPSSISTQDFRHTERFVLGFSPDESLAVTARSRGDTVTVLDLKSGVTRSIIDAGAMIRGLGVARGTTVVDNGKVVTWNLPTGVHILHARITPRSSVQATGLDDPIPLMPWLRTPLSASAPYNLTYDTIDSAFLHLDIYDTPTGTHLANTNTTPWGDWVWFTPDGQEVWLLDSTGSGGRGWAIVRDGKSNVLNLEALDSTGSPSGGFPWQSSRGCQVTDDGWILNSTGKRLLWLPPHWRSAEVHRAWCGRFLALLHPGLPEVVVLEVLVE